MIAFTIGSCTSNEGVNTEERKVEFATLIDDPTEITFEEDSYNFGTVKEGEMVKHTFKFTNTGDKNLVLIDVRTSCGCTVPEDWPKQPIPPGEGGEVKVVFNSNDRVGNVNKGVRVEANTNPTVTTVNLIGVVEE